MEYLSKDNKIVIKGICDFNPRHTFDCGQCFRWNEEPDGSYTGVANGKVVNVRFLDDEIIIDNASEEDFKNFWHNYLDIERDYSKIKSLDKEDKFLKDAIEFGWGIHILNQDIFECLISFIISTQNQIPRIKKIVESFCTLFGDEIEYKGKIYHSFPDITKLKNVTLKDLEPIKAGYRSDYILDAVSCILDGRVDLSSIKNLSYPMAKAELMKIKGVGPKVADCVLLFSGGKSEAFPVDVWVKRTMSNLYLNDGAKEKEIIDFASKYFGEYAGFYQQYLFYYSRENNIKF